MKDKNLFNIKGLKSFRSSLRNRSTSAEATLWNFLKSKSIEGRKFRRQYSIGNYIVDFCVLRKTYNRHLTEIRTVNIIEYRKMKTEIQYLESLGFIVLRFEKQICISGS